NHFKEKGKERKKLHTNLSRVEITPDFNFLDFSKREYRGIISLRREILDCGNKFDYTGRLRLLGRFKSTRRYVSTTRPFISSGIALKFQENLEVRFVRDRYILIRRRRSKKEEDKRVCSSAACSDILLEGYGRGGGGA
ncbi:hypothetical protein K0M31_014240, partial [Melipona bicolor]